MKHKEIYDRKGTNFNCLSMSRKIWIISFRRGSSVWCIRFNKSTYSKRRGVNYKTGAIYQKRGSKLWRREKRKKSKLRKFLQTQHLQFISIPNMAHISASKIWTKIILHFHFIPRYGWKGSLHPSIFGVFPHPENGRRETFRCNQVLATINTLPLQHCMDPFQLLSTHFHCLTLIKARKVHSLSVFFVCIVHHDYQGGNSKSRRKVVDKEREERVNEVMAKAKIKSIEQFSLLFGLLSLYPPVKTRKRKRMSHFPFAGRIIL